MLRRTKAYSGKHKHEASVEFPGGHRAAGLGNPSSSNRHPEGVRREPSQRPGAQRRQSLDRGHIRAGRHRPGAIEHRHRPHRFFIRRPGPDRPAPGPGGDAGRRRGHQPDGRGVLVRPVLAFAAVHLRRGGAVPLAPVAPRGPHRPHPDRPGPDAAGAAADRRVHRNHDPVADGEGPAGVDLHRSAAGDHRGGVPCRGRLLEPRHRPADGHDGGLRPDAPRARAGAGAGRQSRKRLAGGADNRQVVGRSAAGPAGESGVQGRRRCSSRSP